MTKESPFDRYGFAAAALSGLRVFAAASRCTGRTMAMLAQVKDGDRIICSESREQRRLQHLLRDAGKKVDVVVVVRGEHPMSRHGTGQGTTYFDHGWVEAYFQMKLEHAAAELHEMQVAMSKRYPEDVWVKASPPDVGMNINDFYRRWA